MESIILVITVERILALCSYIALSGILLVGFQFKYIFAQERLTKTERMLFNYLLQEREQIKKIASKEVREEEEKEIHSILTKR